MFQSSQKTVCNNVDDDETYLSSISSVLFQHKASNSPSVSLTSPGSGCFSGGRRVSMMLHRRTTILGPLLWVCCWHSNTDENVGRIDTSNVSRFSNAIRGGICLVFSSGKGCVTKWSHSQCSSRVIYGPVLQVQ